MNSRMSGLRWLLLAVLWNCATVHSVEHTAAADTAPMDRNELHTVLMERLPQATKDWLDSYQKDHKKYLNQQPMEKLCPVVALSVIHYAVPDKKVKKMCEEKIEEILTDATTSLNEGIPSKFIMKGVDPVLTSLEGFFQKHLPKNSPKLYDYVKFVSKAFRDLDNRAEPEKSEKMGIQEQVMSWITRTYAAYRAALDLETGVKAVNKLKEPEAAEKLVETLVKAGIKIIALDFDYTMIREHTSLKGFLDRQLPDDAKKLTTIAYNFMQFAHVACDKQRYPNLKVVVATMSDDKILERIRNDPKQKYPITDEQWDRHRSNGDLLAGEALVTAALKASKFPLTIAKGEHIDAVFGFNTGWHDGMPNRKTYHLEQIRKTYNVEPHEVVLIDDKKENVDQAVKEGHYAIKVFRYGGQGRQPGFEFGGLTGMNPGGISLKA
eukprot:GHVU01165611.1.p1 GENE.GHVU01165611.1~~GHVU01165611.1.p1  ORF type:complete len:436 (+),score=59.34 GHVU01165611.1:269-1576(+)